MATPLGSKPQVPRVSLVIVAWSCCCCCAGVHWSATRHMHNKGLEGKEKKGERRSGEEWGNRRRKERGERAGRVEIGTVLRKT